MKFFLAQIFVLEDRVKLYIPVHTNCGTCIKEYVCFMGHWLEFKLGWASF